jgi:amino acid transporter
VQKEIVRRSFSLFKFIFGNPLATDQMHNEKIRKLKGLAIFASDALSSVAYATEEILLVLIVVGASSLTLSIPIALAITLLIFLVAISYRQIIMAYPNGGGSYLVSKENLGTLPSLIAGSSLMIDYILTVAVSVAAGVAAITSAIPILYHHKVALCLLVITLITITNLRGIRDTANVFVMPTYVFIVTIFGLIIYGFYYQMQHPPLPLAPMFNDIAKPLLFLFYLKHLQPAVPL